MSVFVIIPAGGSGLRFGSPIKKQFLQLNGQAIIDRTVSVFIQTGLFKKIVVCLPKDEMEQVAHFNWPSNVLLAEGGATRAESVYRGFTFLSPDENDLVLVHDAVRPLVDLNLINKVILKMNDADAVVPVLPITDTIKEVSEQSVVKTLDRSRLVTIQTPQAFKASVLSECYKRADLKSPHLTDESALVESFGVNVQTVSGDAKNIKITGPQDLKLASFLLTSDLNKD